MRKKSKFHLLDKELKKDYDFEVRMSPKLPFSQDVKDVLLKQRNLIVSEDFDTSANAGVFITNFFLDFIENAKVDNPKVKDYIIGVCVEDEFIGRHNLRVVVTKTKRKTKNTPYTVITQDMTLNGEERKALFF